jgi:prevent-host-death family protein
LIRVKTVNVHEAKTHLSRLLERVRAGEEIIIAKNGEPCARLCPLAPPARRQPGLLSGTVDDSFFAPLPEEELEAWES